MSFLNNLWKENIERKRARKKHIILYFFSCFSFSLSLVLSVLFAYNQSCVKRATNLVLYHHHHRRFHWRYRTNRNQHTRIYIYILSHSRWTTNRTHHNYIDPIIPRIGIPMNTKSKKDFSVAFLLRDNNNNDCEYTYPSNGSSPSKSSCSPPNWNSVSLLNNSSTLTPSNTFWLSGKSQRMLSRERQTNRSFSLLCIYRSIGVNENLSIT